MSENKKEYLRIFLSLIFHFKLLKRKKILISFQYLTFVQDLSYSQMAI